MGRTSQTKQAGNMKSCRRFKSISKYQLNDKKFNRLKHFMITENWNQIHNWSTFHLKHKFYATFKYFSNSTGLWFLFSSPLFTVPSRLHRWLWVTAVQDCGEMGRRKSLTQSLRMNTWPFIFFSSKSDCTQEIWSGCAPANQGQSTRRIWIPYFSSDSTVTSAEGISRVWSRDPHAHLKKFYDKLYDCLTSCEPYDYEKSQGISISSAINVQAL